LHESNDIAITAKGEARVSALFSVTTESAA